MKFATARERTLATGTYYASMLSLGFATAVVGPTLAGLAARTGASIGALGIVFTATSIGYLLGSLQSGRWFDRLPGHRLLAAAALVVAAALAGVTVTTSLWPLTAAFLVLGAASATIDVGTNTLLLLIFRDRVGGVMNGLHFCFGAGALAAPAIVAGSIRASNDIAMAYLILAAVTLPVAAAFLAIPAAPRPGHARQRDRVPAPRGLIALIAAVFACYVAAEVGFGGWISTYALELGFGDAADTAYLASVFWGCLTLGRLIAVPLAGRIRASSLIAIDFAGALMCLIAIAWAPQSKATLWIATGLFGFFLASIYPMLLVYSGERMPVSGRSTSWYMAASSLGSMSLPWLIGGAFVALGPASLLWLDGAAVALGAALFWAATRHTHATSR